MKRRAVKAGKDHRIFNKTAVKTKRINIRPGHWRGGIML